MQDLTFPHPYLNTLSGCLFRKDRKDMRSDKRTIGLRWL